MYPQRGFNDLTEGATNMNDTRPPLNLELIHEDIKRTKPQLNKLGKLYEMRDKRDDKVRFGVKPRFIQNEGYSFFRELREYLKVNKKGRLT